MNLHMRMLHFGFLVGFLTVLGLCGVLLLDLFKLSYLPWRDARSQGAAGEQRQKSLTTGPLTVLNERLMSGNWCDCRALAQRDGAPPRRKSLPDGRMRGE